MGGLVPTDRGGGGEGKQTNNNKRARKGAPAVTYKYNEGFTNAVRRPVFMRDLE